MKKNIIIALLVITNILLYLYGQQQRSEANEALMVANQQRELAEEIQLKAIKAEELALEILHKAQAQVEIAKQEAIASQQDSVEADQELKYKSN